MSFPGGFGGWVLERLMCSDVSVVVRPDVGFL